MTEYDPEKERILKDFCTYKRCKEPSTIIIQGKGRCDAHNFSIAGVDETYEEPLQDDPPQGSMYRSIEDYSAKTGKRFRMTREEKQRNLTRQQAFEERYG